MVHQREQDIINIKADCKQIKNEKEKLENFKNFVAKKLNEFHNYDRRNAVFNNYTKCKKTLEQIFSYYLKLWGKN